MERVEPDRSPAAAPDGERSFDLFYEDAWTRSVRLAALLTQDSSVAEEIAQDAFVAVMDRWSSLDEPAGYLYRCVTNAAMLYHRSAGTARRKLPLVGIPEPARPEFDHLADAVASLQFRQRAVIVLRYYLQLSEREIADALGCRPGTVKSLASRALSRLHKELS